MSNKPIFVATHPRACSTAFERVFMTRTDILKCAHEPFGDAYYFGPERLAERYEDDEKARSESGFADSTFQTIFDRINADNTEGKRLLIKDMAQYFVPPNHRPVSIAPSLIAPGHGGDTDHNTSASANAGHVKVQSSVRSNNLAHQAVANSTQGFPYPTEPEPNNPTVLPTGLLEQFHFAFLIRHPRKSIPSYYRCTIPPLDKVTGFYYFRPDEAGYDELRRTFDYLRSVGHVGPTIAGQSQSSEDEKKADGNGNGNSKVEICVIDADDLLDKPNEIIEAFCKSVGIDYSSDMLNWDRPEQKEYAMEVFEKWKGFHEDAIHSTDLKPRKHREEKTDEQYYADWVDKYGKEAAETIRKTVDENVADYEYLKQFAVKV